MGIYYKATRLDGTDFYTGAVDYAAALANGTLLRVRTPAQDTYQVCTSDVLHASLRPEGTLIGGSWPCRLFQVKGRPVASGNCGKYGFRSLTVVAEVEAWRALGPQGREVAALIERTRRLTRAEIESLTAARYAARDAAWDAAWGATRGATRDATRVAAWAAARARDAARDAAWDAARAAARAAAALVTRDLITTADYDTLTGPWRHTIGPLHPDDPELRDV